MDQLGLPTERKHARVFNKSESSPAIDSPCHVYDLHHQDLGAATDMAVCRLTYGAVRGSIPGASVQA